MNRARDVKPITYLKTRAAALVREVNEAKRAVTITQNGEAKVVVMDVDTYDRWRAGLALLKMLALAEGDVAAERTATSTRAFRRAAAQL